MARTERNRFVWGLVSMFLGLALLIGAAYVAGEPDLKLAAKSAVATASAAGGGFLTFVVARRLLTSSRDEDAMK